jgi:hypothetical protein
LTPSACRFGRAVSESQYTKQSAARFDSQFILNEVAAQARHDHPIAVTPEEITPDNHFGECKIGSDALPGDVSLMVAKFQPFRGWTMQRLEAVDAKETSVAGLTKSATINWTLTETMREFYQNLLDHVRKITDIEATSCYVHCTNEREWRAVITHADGSLLAAITADLAADGSQCVRFSQMHGFMHDVCFLVFTTKAPLHQGDDLQRHKGMLGCFGEGFKVSIHKLLCLGAQVYLANGPQINGFKFGHRAEFPTDEQGATEVTAEVQEGSRPLVRLMHYVDPRPAGCEQGIEFTIMLPKQSVLLAPMFSSLGLWLQPKRSFLQVSPSASIALADDEFAAGWVYVGGLFVRRDPELCGLVINLSPVSANLSRLCRLELQRDRTDFKIWNGRDCVSLASYLVLDICAARGPPPAHIWTEAIIQRFMKELQLSSNLNMMYRAQLSLAPATRVLLLPASLAPAVRGLQTVLQEEELEKKSKICFCAVNSKVQADLYDLDVAVVLLTADLATRIKMPDHEGAHALAFCARYPPNRAYRFVDKAASPIFAEMHPKLAEIVIRYPDGIWSDNCLWVPVCLLDNDRAVRILLDHICRRLGYPRVLFDQISVACVSRALDAAAAEEANWNSRHQKFDEYVKSLTVTDVLPLSPKAAESAENQNHVLLANDKLQGFVAPTGDHADLTVARRKHPGKYLIREETTPAKEIDLSAAVAISTKQGHVIWTTQQSQTLFNHEAIDQFLASEGAQEALRHFQAGQTRSFAVCVAGVRYAAARIPRQVTVHYFWSRAADAAFGFAHDAEIWINLCPIMEACYPALVQFKTVLLHELAHTILFAHGHTQHGAVFENLMTQLLTCS